MTSIQGLATQAKDHRHVKAVRESLMSVNVPASFAVVDNNNKVDDHSAPNLSGRLMESLFNWGFYLTNGFFPYVDPKENESMKKGRLHRMAVFEKALKDV